MSGPDCHASSFVYRDAIEALLSLASEDASVRLFLVVTVLENNVDRFGALEALARSCSFDSKNSF